MSTPIPKPYIADFEQLGFGMFVHWGLYSQLGKGEWVYHINSMNMAEYEKLKNTFEADDFDAERLVITAKNAGCKYITFTTRHHEGFSLYDTCGLSGFDSLHSPARRDLVREFADACNKHRIIPFLYHTTLDWHNPYFENDFDKYLEYLRNSIEILCVNYGKIGGIWFDGNWSKPNADWKEDELYQVIRKHQPEAIIVNNTGINELGKLGNAELDSVTFEQGKPIPLNRDGMEKYIAAEMCQTVNDHWGIGAHDLNYKSPCELIENLCYCRNAGANYLLNIGLEAQGSINPYQEQLFSIIGKWSGKFGEAVYNGRPYNAGGPGKNFILKSINGDCLYIFAFDLGNKGNGNVTVGGKYSGSYSFGNVLQAQRIEKIEWMDNSEQLSFGVHDDMLTINMTGYEYGDSYCVRVAKAYLK